MTYYEPREEKEMDKNLIPVNVGKNLLMPYLIITKDKTVDDCKNPQEKINWLAFQLLASNEVSKKIAEYADAITFYRKEGIEGDVCFLENGKVKGLSDLKLAKDGTFAVENGKETSFVNLNHFYNIMMELKISDLYMKHSKYIEESVGKHINKEQKQKFIVEHLPELLWTSLNSVENKKHILEDEKLAEEREEAYQKRMGR